jgi:hypothetical protein
VRTMRDSEAERGPSTSALDLAGRVAQGLRASLQDPRRVAQEVIREKLGDAGPFLGDGTPERPWIVFDRGGDFYAFYVRGRELVNARANGPDTVVCCL